MMAIELLQQDESNDPRRSKILDTIYLSCRRGADSGASGPHICPRGRAPEGRRYSCQSWSPSLQGIITETFPRNLRISVDVRGEALAHYGRPNAASPGAPQPGRQRRDSMPHGGTLTLSASNVKVDAQFAATSQGAKAGTFVLLQVSDTGCGIPPEVRERSLSPSSRPRRWEGHGSRPLDRAHGRQEPWRVPDRRQRCRPGIDVQGYTFRPTRPIEGRRERTPPSPPTCRARRGELVLVIDDEPSIREITQQTLEAFRIPRDHRMRRRSRRGPLRQAGAGRVVGPHRHDDARHGRGGDHPRAQVHQPNRRHYSGQRTRAHGEASPRPRARASMISSRNPTRRRPSSCGCGT
jgi:hypothetical protein